MLALIRYFGWVALVALMAGGAHAFDVSQAEWEQMKKEIQDLRHERTPVQLPDSRVSQALDNKYGPNADVTTKTGKLTINGLIQVWYYHIQHDPRGLFDDPTLNHIPDSNVGQDTDSFRLRRTELTFTMDVTENVRSVIMIDPAREMTTFPNMPANQGLFKRTNQVAPEFLALNKPNGLNATASIVGVQTGGGSAARSLKDAYVFYHDFIPHHDVMIGQHKPYFGEESIRSSSQLDFIERAMIGVVGDVRDLGLTVHGSWWESDTDGRVQYWISVLDGAAAYANNNPDNRPDDNDAKDVGFRALVRPLWKHDKWGSLELGLATQFGHHGQPANVDPILDPVNGLNHRETWAYKDAAWGAYMPGGVLKGWWTRAEWALYHDRNAPNSVIDLTGNGDAATTVAGKFKPAFGQSNPRPFTSQGWHIDTGYKFGDSHFAECDLPNWLKPFEVVFRYDVFQNVEVADPADSAKTLLFKTAIYTGGINYFIKGHNAKIQLDYNFVHNPGSDGHPDIKFHQTHSDSLMLNFQVAF